MSVLIRGMKMPKCCDDCCLLYDCCSCIVTGYSVAMIKWDTEHKRLPDCPLIEIPDHGDLVDRDELMMKMWEASAYAPNHCSWVNARVVFAKDIEDAPVIIPAERSEDGET